MKDINILKNSFRFARIFASLFSVIGGWLFVREIIELTIDNYIITLIISGVFLLLYELFSVIILSISFNFLFNKKNKLFKLFFIAFPIALILYLGSFYFTLNGAGKWVEIKTNEKVIIKKNSQEDIELSDSIFENKIKYYETKFDSINSVNKNPWLHYESKQINLDFYSSQIQKLTIRKDSLSKNKILEQKENIIENNIELQEVSKKYYAIAIVIMIFILVCNCMFSYLKHYDNEQDCNKIADNCKTISKEIQDIMNSNFTEEDKIKTMLNLGYNQKKIAEFFKVNESTISRKINKYKLK